jgi:predicted MFS family arabinose efflux permease
MLSAAYFVQATGALAVIGAMDAIAATWQVSRTEVGQLITAFGLSFALLAPLLQLSAPGRWPRRRQLLTGMAGFALCAALAALSQDHAQLLLARVGMGASAALISPVLGALGSSLVAPAEQGAAIARVLTGLSLAAVVGTPAAAWLAHVLGPRWLFGAVAALATLTALGLRALVPAGPAVPANPAGALRSLIGRPRGLASFLVVLCIAAGVFSFQSYLEPVVKLYAPGQTGAAATATALGVLGLAGIAGNTWLAWAARAHSADRLLTAATVALAALLIAIAVGPRQLPVLYAMLALWAMAADVVWPTQQRRVVEFWPDQRGLALALTASFMFCGMGVGAALGGAMQVRYGLPGLAGAGTAWFALALLMIRVTRRPQTLAATRGR